MLWTRCYVETDAQWALWVKQNVAIRTIRVRCPVGKVMDTFRRWPVSWRVYWVGRSVRVHWHRSAPVRTLSICRLRTGTLSINPFSPWRLADTPQLARQLVFWAQSTTGNYIRAQNELPSIFLVTLRTSHLPLTQTLHLPLTQTLHLPLTQDVKGQTHLCALAIKHIHTG